jgi:hypothetical protein
MGLTLFAICEVVAIDLDYIGDWMHSHRVKVTGLDEVEKRVLLA